MKLKSLKLIILFLVFALQACNKIEHVGPDVFRVTFVGPSNGCPGGPLVRVGKNDIDRLAHLLDVTFSEGFHSQRVISAVNLKGSYREAQTLTVKIRQFTSDDAPICTANVPWYLGVYVIEEYAD